MATTNNGLIGLGLFAGALWVLAKIFGSESSRLSGAPDDIDFTRIDNDINGNPRYVVHYLNFLKEGEKGGYETALKRARKLGGKKFHNKQYGGGIVFQSYNTNRLAERIKELVNEPEKKKLSGTTKKHFLVFVDKNDGTVSFVKKFPSFKKAHIYYSEQVKTFKLANAIHSSVPRNLFAGGKEYEYTVELSIPEKKKLSGSKINSLPISTWFKSLDINKRIQIAERYTDETGDNTNIAKGLNKESEKWLSDNFSKQIKKYK